MKDKLFLNVLVIIFLCGSQVNAQPGNGEFKLSLKEAQEYAIQNNKLVISSRLDLSSSKIALWETASNLLPQVSASASFTDNLKLMTTLLPGDFFGKPGELVPVTFGSQFNSGATVQASLLLFNAPLYIGIETSKLARTLSEESVTKSELDTKESVTLAYYLILISEKSLTILDANIENLKETLKSTRSMYQAGMAEMTDIDQMVTNVTDVENARSSMQRTIELNYNMLRFQLGLSAESTISLTETLETLIAEINVEALLLTEFDHRQNIDYKLTEGEEKMSLLALKSQKTAVLPSLSGFYTYGTNGMGDKIGQLRWFPNSMTGLQLNIPIFASGQRYSSIRKAQVNLEKAKNAKEMVKDQLLLQEKQLRYNLVNANLQYKSQKDNIEVSQRVYTSMENKFKQGMASSLELTQTNSLYLQAENNYITSLLNLLQTKLALDKLLNNL